MSSSKPEVLIVDDSPTIRATIAKFLGGEFITHTATDGEEGWQVLERNDAISLVFADMHMPVLNGMLLLQRIRQSDQERIANVPVIMITGVEDSRAAKRACHTLGATDFISKPFDKNEILRRANNYTTLNRRIAEFAEDPKRNALAGLDNNRVLLDFGNKSINFSASNPVDVSILYTEIAGMDKLINDHGHKITEQIVESIYNLLAKNLRKDELISRIDDGKFVIVLPMTKAFKAHIIASRLKKAVRKIEFHIAGNKLRVSLAVGLTSTDASVDNKVLTFKDYCVQAALALRTSLETAKHPVVRYDETYEKQFENLPDTLEVQQAEDDDANGDAALEEFGEFFSGILMGDYSAIPQSYIPTLIEPLEKFLDYAHELRNPDVHKKAS